MAWTVKEKLTGVQVAALLNTLAASEAGRAKIVPLAGMHQVIYSVFYQEVDK